MTIKKFIYISGPRMGQNNTMNGIDAKSAKRTKATKSNRRKGNGSKKRS
jgi:hypothetical protein